MADWQIDLTFVNLGAMPEIKTLYFSVEASNGWGETPYMAPDENGQIAASVTLSGAVATEKCWVIVHAFSGPLPEGPGEFPDRTGIWVLGPYTVGDIGTEVPAP